MSRHLLPVVAALLVGAVFLLPQPRPSSQLAQQVGGLLLDAGAAQRVVPGEGEGEGPSLVATEETLYGHLRASTAFVETDGKLQFRLGGVRVSGDENARADIVDNLAARKSLARALRTITLENEGAELEVLGEDAPRADVGGAGFDLQLVGDQALLQLVLAEGPEPLQLQVQTDYVAPERTSLLPPIVAVALAILIRKPLVALFAGVFIGAFLVRLAAGAGVVSAAGTGFLNVFQGYLRGEMSDNDRWLTIGFVFFMLAMVGVMTRAGGIQGLMDRIARLADSAKRTQIATYLMGLAIFFDDYANTILVGSTMRSLSDRFKVAREKLAYLVDSTAAPVAGLSIFSTWIAFEVSTFSAQLPTAGMSPSDGYEVFFRTIPYSFYCVLTLVFVGLVAFTGRDLGPMLDAERRARHTGKLVADGSTPMVGEEGTELKVADGVEPQAWRALFPLATFLFVTIFEIFRNGGAFASGSEVFTLQGFIEVLYNGSGYWPLFAGSLAGFLAASIGAVSGGAGNEILDASWKTIRSMWVAFAILYLAWMIGAVCGDLGTAPYLTSLVEGVLDAKILPTIVFVLAGLVALATGSSWSTMSILLPLVVPLAYALGEPAGLAATGPESGQLLMVICIAAVLSGSIFGDHCSPISDTTVMSSISAASDHIDHVRTQAPYAILVTGVAILTGYLPCTYVGLSPWISLALGAVALVVLLRLFGRRADELGPLTSDA